jgi:NTE family protein
MGAVANSELLARRVVSERRILLVAAFGAFLAFLDTTIVNVAFPSIRESFPHTSFGALSWVLNAYNIVFAAMLVAAGRVADLLGRRRAFRVGVVVFVVGSAACALAWSVPVLVACRCLQAVGGAILVPASLAIVIAGAPAERRSHAVGLWGASAAVAAGLGPPIGGALVQISDWRLTFLVNVPLGVAALLVTRSSLVESRAPEFRTMPDLAGTTYLGLALGALTLAVVEGPTWGWTSLAVLASFTVAAGSAALLVRSSRHHLSPILDPKLLRIQTFGVSNALLVLAGMGFYAYLLNHILWLRYVWGWSVLKAGLALAPGAFVAAAVAGPLGRLADKHGHRVVVVPGAIVWALSFWWYVARVGTDPHFLTQWLPGQLMSGVGVGATLPVLTSAGLAAVPGGRYATASAAMTSARQLGGALGIALLVVILGTPTAATVVPSLRHGWEFVAGCFVAVAVGGLFLSRPREHVEHDEAVGAATVEVGSVSSVEVRDPVPAGSAVRRGLATIAWLAELPNEVTRQLTARAKRMSVPAGEWLFHAGETADALYVVDTGRVDVIRDDVIVQELGPGGVIGELGLLTAAPRAASVRARRDSELLRVSKRTFDRVLSANPQASRQLASALARQVQAGRPVERAAAAPSVISVVGLGSHAPTQHVSATLVAELLRYLSVIELTATTADGLERAERAHDRVVLVAGPHADTEWREFCLRQADRLVLVADDAAPPAALSASWPAGAELVLPEGPPSVDEVSAWHALLAPRRLHTVDRLGALARRFAGRSVGLALAGGGARSFAHIGVIEELVAAGVRIDRVSGTSVGAFIAALFASGLDVDAIDARCYEEFVRRTPHGDYTIPRVALSRGERGRAMMRRTFGDTLIEQLPREFVCVSTDLLSRERVVHARGSLRDAVSASISLPGLFPPHRQDGRLLIDGGVLDNLPVEPLANSGEGPVIAVNIGTAGRTPKPDAAEPRMPAIGESLMRVLLMSSANALSRARQSSAVVITPDTRGVGLLEFHQIDRMRESGRAAAREALAALNGQLDHWTRATTS